jgi:signal-transduction protein with cAMP-binding, CBS, and nucleotidyltransferase domain
MKVQECMRSPAVTCRAETSLVAVARLMEWEEVGSVVVMSMDDRILGIVTDRDLTMAIARELPAATHARDVISRPPIVIHEHEDVYDAAAQMTAARCRRLPVINVAGKLVGVVAIDDLVGAFSRRTEPRQVAAV